MFDFDEQIFNDRIEHEHHSYNFQRKSLTKQKSAIQKPSIAYRSKMASYVKTSNTYAISSMNSKPYSKVIRSKKM